MSLSGGATICSPLSASSRCSLRASGVRLPKLHAGRLSQWQQRTSRTWETCIPRDMRALSLDSEAVSVQSAWRCQAMRNRSRSLPRTGFTV